MADIDQIIGNITKMREQKAPDVDIKEYLLFEGVTQEEVEAALPQSPLRLEEGIVRGSLGAPFSPERLKSDLRLSPAQMQIGGGMVGGVLGTPLGPPGIVLGAALGAEGAKQFAELANRFVLGEDDPTLAGPESPGTRAGEAAANVLLDMGLTKVGGQIVEGARSIPAGLKKLIRKESGRQTALTRLDELDVPLEGAAAAISQSRTVRGSVEIIRKLPGGGDVIQRGLDKSMLGLSEAFDRIIGRVGLTRTAQQGGAVLRKGLISEAKDFPGFTQRFRTKAQQVYNKLNTFIKPDEPTPIQNTVNVFVEQLAKFKDLPNVSKAVVPVTLRGFMADFKKAKGVIKWEQLQAFRTYVGRQTGSTQLTSDVTQGQWKQLYAGIMTDMKQMASTKGTRALQAFTRADQFYAGGLRRIDDFVENIIKNPAVEQNFMQLFSGDKVGASRLLAIRKSLRPEEWIELVGAKLHLMGQEAAGGGAAGIKEFSPSQFLRTFRDLPKESKKVLFGEETALRASLEKLVAAAGDFATTPGFGTSGGTAGGLGFFFALRGLGLGTLAGAAATQGVGGAVTGAAIGLGITGAGVLSDVLAAKLLTHVPFVRWLAKAIIIAPTNFNSIANHLQRLTLIAETQDAIAEPIAYYLDNLKFQTELWHRSNRTERVAPF